MTRYKYDLKEGAQIDGKLSGEDNAGQGDSMRISTGGLSISGMGGIQEKGLNDARDSWGNSDR